MTISSWYILLFSIISINLISLAASNPINVSEPEHRSVDTRILYTHLIGKKPCQFKGKTYLSGQRIPRRHPCHNCLCIKGNIDCFWQDCPPPPEGCSTLEYEGICNPSMYECPIPEHNQTVIDVKKKQEKYGSRKSDAGLVHGDCVIRGIAYFTGETIGVASNNCLECRCAKNSMFCTPLCCFQHVPVNEEFPNNNYRTNRNEGRPLDPNPLAHLHEELGLPPGGTV